MATVYEDGKQSIELAKFTTKLYKLVQSQDEAEGIEAIERQYDFVKLAFGASKEAKNFLNERLDGSDIDSIDLMQLSALYNELQVLYAEPISEIQSKITSDRFAAIAPLAESAMPVIAAMKDAENIGQKPNRQTRRAFQNLA